MSQEAEKYSVLSGSSYKQRQLPVSIHSEQDEKGSSLGVTGSKSSNSRDETEQNEGNCMKMVSNE